MMAVRRIAMAPGANAVGLIIARRSRGRLPRARAAARSHGALAVHDGGRERALALDGGQRLDARLQMARRAARVAGFELGVQLRGDVKELAVARLPDFEEGPRVKP